MSCSIGPSNGKDVFILEKVVLGDIDCALKLTEENPLNSFIGNFMWRSLEGQLGKEIGKHSEVFSFGLLCLYVITSTEWLHLDLNELDTNHEPLLTAFGPLPEAVVSHVSDKDKETLLWDLWKAMEEEKLFDPFGSWQEQTFPNLTVEAKKLISDMTNPDPTQRLSMSEVLNNPFWDEILHVDSFSAPAVARD
ncbi:hypothetical protein E4T52_16997 [Aureobasidium sp. EXF-3400]|nr:hypothetical protein E4T51_16173 [Aureobasidium sp. EXF-12344]KAI4767876.1 hypothetical protein E4T52_16997 [Aureobasidium sp. EXF-3400]